MDPPLRSGNKTKQAMGEMWITTTVRPSLRERHQHRRWWRQYFGIAGDRCHDCHHVAGQCTIATMTHVVLMKNVGSKYFHTHPTRQIWLRQITSYSSFHFRGPPHSKTFPMAISTSSSARFNTGAPPSPGQRAKISVIALWPGRATATEPSTSAATQN